MKKRMKTLAYLCLLATFCPSLNSQTFSPDQWEMFITEQNTTFVSDTFRLQSFSDDVYSNWNYSANGNYAVFEASTSGIAGGSSGRLIKLEPGSTLHMERAYSTAHQSVKGGLAYAFKNLMKEEDMKITLYHGGEVEEVSHYNVPIDNFSTSLLHLNIDRNLYGLDLNIASPAQNTNNGFYGVDSVYLYGNIPAFSLFKGEGFWNDTTAWSHLPAERHRHALIQGKINIDRDVVCDQVSVAGELQINKGKALHLGDLNIYETSTFVKNEGELFLNDKITLTRTFPESGVWYFVSFPFDVYADGLDPAFFLKDDTPNSGGNYIYVLSYDGKKRSEENSNQNNWSVLPESTGNGSSPVFEKNKGYLLAIDKLADRTTLHFASKTKSISSSFGKNAEVSISIPYTIEANKKNEGWQLCGNPLPFPLHVNQLDHPDLDGYVYLYNGENYTPLPLDGNYTLPPYSAFFLKAKQSVSIPVGITDETPAIPVLLAMEPLRGRQTEPSVDTSVNTDLIKKMSCRMTKNLFLLEKATEGGEVMIFDGMGFRLSTTTFVAGESLHIPLPDQPGFYILLLQTQSGRTEYKFVR